MAEAKENQTMVAAVKEDIGGSIDQYFADMRQQLEIKHKQYTETLAKLVEHSWQHDESDKQRLNHFKKQVLVWPHKSCLLSFLCPNVARRLSLLF